MVNLDRLQMTKEWAKEKRRWDFQEVVLAVSSTIFLLQNEFGDINAQEVIDRFKATFLKYISGKGVRTDAIVIREIFLLDEIEISLVDLVDEIESFFLKIYEVAALGLKSDDVRLQLFRKNIYYHFRRFLIEDYFLNDHDDPHPNPAEKMSFYIVQLRAYRDLLETGIITKKLYEAYVNSILSDNG